MADSNLLDKETLDIVRGTIFIDRLHWFLRKYHRFSDTAVRIASEDLLKKYARKFCGEWLERFFPEIRATGYPDADLIYREVMWHYKNLKVELLNKAKLKRPIQPKPIQSKPIQSKPILPSRNSEPMTPPRSSPIPSSPLPVLVQASLQPAVSRKRQRRRKRLRKPHEEPTSVVPNTTVKAHGETRKTKLESVLPAPAAQTKAELSPEQKLPELLISSQSSTVTTTSFCSQMSLSDRPIIFKKITPIELSQQMMMLKENNKRLQAENRRLQTENQNLTKYHTFANTTLRICQDTYLEEANSAKRAGIYSQKAQCSMIVDVLRDLNADLDMEYFLNYYKLHNRAPPSRYWLDSVFKKKQRYDMLKACV